MSKPRNSIKVLLSVFLIITLNQTGVGVAAEPSDTARQIRALFDRAEVAVEARDREGLLALIHPQSPVAEETRQRVSRIIKDQQLEEKVIGYHFLAEDPPYAFARAQVKWIGKGKQGFRNNITDTLYIFKKDGAQWKLWGELPLGIVVLNGSG